MPVGGFDYLYIALQMKEKPMFDCGYVYAPYLDLKPPPYNLLPFRQTPTENVSYSITEEQRVANLAALMTMLPSMEEEECGEPVDWSKEGF